MASDFSGKAKQELGIPGNSRSQELPFPLLVGHCPIRDGIPGNSREFPFLGIHGPFPTEAIAAAISTVKEGYDDKYRDLAPCLLVVVVLASINSIRRRLQ